jgi:hypothetical protein
MVADNAPKFVTCPRCLAIIESPMSTGHGPPPLPGIPLDQEAGHDARIARGIIAVLAVLVLIGVYVQFMATSSSGQEAIAYIAVIVVAIVMLILAGLIGKPAKPEEFESPRAGLTSDQTHIAPIELQYRSKRSDQQQKRIRGGAFAGGFFASLAVCAGGFFLLGATMDMSSNGSHAIFLLIVATAVIGTIVMGVMIGRKPAMIGFGQGMMVGLVLGMLALGPCAFCYLLTIK